MTHDVAAQARRATSPTDARGGGVTLHAAGLGRDDLAVPGQAAQRHEQADQQAIGW